VNKILNKNKLRIRIDSQENQEKKKVNPLLQKWINKRMRVK
jgi:hypothetical protein